MTKRTNRSRGGLSPSRGPGRGLFRATRVYSRDQASPPKSVATRASRGSVLRVVKAARKVTPRRRSHSKLPQAQPRESPIQRASDHANEQTGSDDHPRPDHCNGLQAATSRGPDCGRETAARGQAQPREPTSFSRPLSAGRSSQRRRQPSRSPKPASAVGCRRADGIQRSTRSWDHELNRRPPLLGPPLPRPPGRGLRPPPPCRALGRRA